MYIARAARRRPAAAPRSARSARRSSIADAISTTNIVQFNNTNIHNTIIIIITVINTES